MLRRPRSAAEAAQRSYEKRIRRNQIRANWELYILVALPLVWLFVFVYIPMYGNIIAFNRFVPGNGFLGGEWVGFAHFRRFLTSYKFGRILRNTIFLNLYSLTAGFPAPIILALLINYCPLPRYRRSVQMITYAPHFISTTVMVGIIYKLFSTRIGIINMMIARFGFQEQTFLGTTTWFPHIYTWTGIWQNMGWGTIIYLAALSSIDPELHDTAMVDGASIWRRMWHVDIRGIMPTIVILLILRTGNVVSIGFEKIFLMQNNLNITASEVIATYVYKIGLAASMPNYSYAAAIGLFQNVVNFILLLSVNRIARKLSSTSLW
jgi:putative aldouronate transport system permease protein